MWTESQRLRTICSTARSTARSTACSTACSTTTADFFSLKYISKQIMLFRMHVKKRGMLIIYLDSMIAPRWTRVNLNLNWPDPLHGPYRHALRSMYKPDSYLGCPVSTLMAYLTYPTSLAVSDSYETNFLDT